MKKYFYLVSLLFVVACGTTKIMTPTQADVDRGMDNFPGLSLAQLHEGQQVYTQSCNKCHGYKKPTSRSASQWKEIVPRMTLKVNHGKADGPIDANRQEALLRYVAVMSNAKKK